MIELDKTGGEAEATVKDAKHAVEGAVASKPWRTIAIIAGLFALLAAVVAFA